MALSSINVNAENTEKLDDLAYYIKDQKTLVNTKNLLIIGNDPNYTYKDFKEIVNNGKSSIYILYRTNNKINLKYDMIIFIKNKYTTENYDFRVVEKSYFLKKYN